MDSRSYWLEVRENEKQLAEGHPEGALYVTSLNNSEKGTTAGRVAQVNVLTAAKLVTGRTHRVSTEAEIEAFVKEGRESAARHRAIERAQKQTFNEVDPSAIAAAVVVALDQIEKGKANKPAQGSK